MASPNADLGFSQPERQQVKQMNEINHIRPNATTPPRRNRCKRPRVSRSRCHRKRPQALEAESPQAAPKLPGAVTANSPKRPKRSHHKHAPSLASTVTASSPKRPKTRSPQTAPSLPGAVTTNPHPQAQSPQTTPGPLGALQLLCEAPPLEPLPPSPLKPNGGVQK